MKTMAPRRALFLANLFNLLVAVYFILIAIISLVRLRWYHQLTVTIKIRHLVTSTTSYFAFFILLFTALLLLAIFVASTVSFTSKTYIGLTRESEPISIQNTRTREHANLPTTSTATSPQQQDTNREQDVGGRSSRASDRLVMVDNIHSTANAELTTSSGVICMIALNLIVAISLIIILIIWLMNTGELVRDSISTQLELALMKYQFSNRSNHYSIAVDGMQDINNCCGSFDYSDFPHLRITGLSSGHYPGSCCGKNIFGANARVLCTNEEIVRAKQTVGCTVVLAEFYDLLSLLITPVALVSLFVVITIIALLTVSRGKTSTFVSHYNGAPSISRSIRATDLSTKL